MRGSHVGAIWHVGATLGANSQTYFLDLLQYWVDPAKSAPILGSSRIKHSWGTTFHTTYTLPDPVPCSRATRQKLIISQSLSTRLSKRDWQTSLSFGIQSLIQCPSPAYSTWYRSNQKVVSMWRDSRSKGGTKKVQTNHSNLVQEICTASFGGSKTGPILLNGNLLKMALSELEMALSHISMGGPCRNE